MGPGKVQNCHVMYTNWDGLRGTKREVGIPHRKSRAELDRWLLSSWLEQFCVMLRHEHVGSFLGASTLGFQPEVPHITGGGI